MPTSFIISDESINDRGFRVLTSGIDIERFKKNPVMLWMHQRDIGFSASQVLPIGIWENIRKENGKLVADPKFDENDKFAQLIKSKVDNGLIRGCSAGIMPVELSSDKSLLLKGQTRETISKSELYEASIVDLPSNKNTVRLFSATEENEVPLLNNNKMADKNDKKELTFSSEADLMSYMKENFGFEPKAEEKKEETKKEFKFESEEDARSWFQKLFNLQPKAPQTEEKEETTELATDNKEVEQLKSDLQKRDTELQELKSQVEALKAAPGADDKKDTRKTDAKKQSNPDDAFETYTSAKSTWDAVNDLME